MLIDGQIQGTNLVYSDIPQGRLLASTVLGIPKGKDVNPFSSGSKIQTRAKKTNKETHPGTLDAPAKRRTQAEMKEAARLLALEERTSLALAKNSIQAAGAIEDALRNEDLAKKTPQNRRIDEVAPFRLPVSKKNSSGLILPKFKAKLTVYHFQSGAVDVETHEESTSDVHIEQTAIKPR